MASEMDTGIGEIIGNLTAAGVLKNTLICFTSDNGGPTNGFENSRATIIRYEVAQKRRRATRICAGAGRR